MATFGTDSVILTTAYTLFEYEKRAVHESRALPFLFRRKSDLIPLVSVLTLSVINGLLLGRQNIVHFLLQLLA
jgi:hypothetical protein